MENKLTETVDDIERVQDSLQKLEKLETSRRWDIFSMGFACGVLFTAVMFFLKTQ